MHRVVKELSNQLKTAPVETLKGATKVVRWTMSNGQWETLPYRRAQNRARLDIVSSVPANLDPTNLDPAMVAPASYEGRHRVAALVDPLEPGPAPVEVGLDVSVRALGPLKVVVSGAPIDTWGGARIRTIFQYLLLHPRPVHREALIELLWPGYSAASARNNLNVSMYGLRRVLGSGGPQDYGVFRDGYYALNPEVAWSLDSVRFEQAANHALRAVAAGQGEIALGQALRAIDEYGGPLFEGDVDAHWCTTERAALSQLFLRTLEALGRLHLERADVDAAERALQRLLSEDACRESAHRLLMICFARRNQRDLIARQFRRCIRMLEQELDIGPSAETVQLYRQLTA